WNQGDFAAVINISNFDLYLIANLDYILNLFDSLVATEVRDVNQAVATRGDGNEGTKGYSLDYRAQEALAHLRKLRISNGIDLFNCCIRCFTGSRGNVNCTVIFDRDISARFFRDGVDRLALRANQLTDLRYWNLNRSNLWCLRGHLIWAVDAFSHDVEDLFTGIACLRQSASQDLRRDTVKLGIELQCGDVVTGPCDLEVHVAECIFCAQDVSQGYEALRAF